MGTVTKIARYKARETIEVLQDLLAQAERGEIKGFAFACKLGEKHHGIGLTGEYRDDPLQAALVASRFTYTLNKLLDEQAPIEDI